MTAVCATPSTSTTQVAHVTKDARHGGGWDLYIGRASRYHGLRKSPFANPFPLGQGRSREEAIRGYALWLAERPELLRQLPGLKGLTLACWCHTVDWRDPRNDAECHGDLLARLADGLPDGVDPVPWLRACLAAWLEERARDGPRPLPAPGGPTG